jgi:hypothetical protein
MTHLDSVSRRTVLRTSAVVAGTLTFGRATVGTAAGTTQEGETFLELFAALSPDPANMVAARGEALGLDAESIPGPAWLPDTSISSPEGILAFVPQRLADEEERVGLDDMLVMTSARTLEGDLTTELTGALIPGTNWFSGEKWVPGDEWFPQDTFVPEEGMEAVQTFAIPGSNWVPGSQWFPEGRWFPRSQWEPGRPPWWEPPESVEEGQSLAELSEEQLLLTGAAGDLFFPQDIFGEEFAMEWEELARAETATVLEL